MLGRTHNEWPTTRPWNPGGGQKCADTIRSNSPLSYQRECRSRQDEPHNDMKTDVRDRASSGWRRYAWREEEPSVWRSRRDGGKDCKREGEVKSARQTWSPRRKRTHPEYQDAAWAQDCRQRKGSIEKSKALHHQALGRSVAPVSSIQKDEVEAVTKSCEPLSVSHRRIQGSQK